MKTLLRSISVALGTLFCLLPQTTTAESSLLIRPQAGFGSLAGAGVSHAGIRVLMPSGKNQRYGVELNHFMTGNDTSFTSAGILLEQRLRGWFNMSVGTIGYIDYNGCNPFGLVTNLGWEPQSTGSIEPFITFRNDIIFSESTDSIYSISAGISLKF